MSTIPYTYSVLRYLHDPAAGEMLSVGVAVYAPGAPYVAARLDHHYERLSQAFADFDGDHYRKSLRQFEAAIDRLRNGWAAGLPSSWELPPDVGSLTGQIWPDAGLSFRFGPVLAGVTKDLEEALSSLFTRMVTSQYVRGQAERRSDEGVWSVYQRPLARQAVARALRPKLFATPEFKLEFDHAFKNERWHVLQPVSMDYVRADSLQAKAARWLGNAMALQGHPELGKLYLLLGAPHLEANRAAYVKAKNLLHKIPVPHELIEEDAADDFAGELADYMRQHGILDNPAGEE
jgi:Protein of unknown function (DUF3037)